MHVQRCCFAKCKSIAFLPFSLPSPTLFLKLPIVVIQKCCYHVVLPHAQLKKQLHDLLEGVFNTKRKSFIATNNFRTFWANDQTSTRYTHFSCRELGLAIDFFYRQHLRLFWKLGFPAVYWYTHGHQQCTFVG